MCMLYVGEYLVSLNRVANDLWKYASTTLFVWVLFVDLLLLCEV